MLQEQVVVAQEEVLPVAPLHELRRLLVPQALEELLLLRRFRSPISLHVARVATGESPRTLAALFESASATLHHADSFKHHRQ